MIPETWETWQVITGVAVAGALGTWLGFFTCALLTVAKDADERLEGGISEAEWHTIATTLSQEKQWQYGYRYGLMIGHAQGMDDAMAGRIQ